MSPTTPRAAPPRRSARCLRDRHVRDLSLRNILRTYENAGGVSHLSANFFCRKSRDKSRQDKTGSRASEWRRQNPRRRMCGTGRRRRCGPPWATPRATTPHSSALLPLRAPSPSRRHTRGFANATWHDDRANARRGAPHHGPGDRRSLESLSTVSRATRRPRKAWAGHSPETVPATVTPPSHTSCPEPPIRHARTCSGHLLVSGAAGAVAHMDGRNECGHDEVVCRERSPAQKSGSMLYLIDSDLGLSMSVANAESACP